MYAWIAARTSVSSGPSAAVSAPPVSSSAAVVSPPAVSSPASVTDSTSSVVASSAMSVSSDVPVSTIVAGFSTESSASDTVGVSSAADAGARGRRDGRGGGVGALVVVAAGRQDDEREGGGERDGGSERMHGQTFRRLESRAEGSPPPRGAKRARG